MIGFVVIGRNEGERLRRCLAPLTLASARVIYVDSGSGDDSIAIADSLGAKIIRLENDLPFTAARARNEGFAALIQAFPDTAYAVFIDGDCELAPSFPEIARESLRANPNVGIIAGKVRERDRTASVYNRLCDMEWAGPIGEIDVCGGIFMIRRAAFDGVEGFDPAIVAAEDDDLCVRVRQSGWKIRRIAADMCVHDAGIKNFGQWWTRAFRAGYAFAQVGEKHEGYFSGERLRAIFWGGALPVVLIVLAPFTKGWSLAGFSLYLVSFLRALLSLKKNGAGVGDALLGALFMVISKFPNLLGIGDYWRKRASGSEVGIVEYK